jgi:hypothetical protein
MKKASGAGAYFLHDGKRNNVPARYKSMHALLLNQVTIRQN